MSFITREFYENKENQKKATQIAWEISEILRDNDFRSYSSSLAAYLLYKIAQIDASTEITFQAITEGALNLTEDVECLVRERLSEDAWNGLLPLRTKYTPEEFAMAAIYPVNDYGLKGTLTTPDSILKLAHKVLNVKANENVADVCCGAGRYMIAEALNEKTAHYRGYEIQTEASTIASMRAELVDADIQVQLCNVFSLLNEKEMPKFDKIFANYPFGTKLRNLYEGSMVLEKLSEKYPGFSKATSSDWIFNDLLCRMLTEQGKAIGIMTNGSTWNSIDTSVRKYFVEKQLVECVIALPGRMFLSTNIPTTMIILSHNNCGVRMIDATQICQNGRRLNEFNDNDITTIVKAMTQDSEYSRTITIEELRENEYNLSLSRYVNKKHSFDNGVPFESVIKSITRGAPCTAKQLDEMVSDDITNMQYLMLANIQNGIIDDNLPYLSTIEPKYDKYCLKNNNLILSKNGYPYKVAVASVKEGQRILANGNLYIIEVDEEKADPYYLKAFFDSEQGTELLKSITVGASIPNIGIDKLKGVEIPIPSLDEQKRLAQKYQAILDEVAVLKLRLERAINKLHHALDEED